MRRGAVAAPTVLPFNVGELGGSISTPLGHTKTHTVQFQSVQTGDGILVAAMAPTLPSALATQGGAHTCTDTKGNTYNAINSFDFQSFPPAVNTGMKLVLFFCDASVAPLVPSVDSITVTWDNDVFDRIVFGWIIRHAGGARFPQTLDTAGVGDLAVFASSQVTLQSPDFTPDRSNGLELALIVTARPIGGFSFSGVAGFDGFYQAKFNAFSGAKQTYLLNCQTHGADAYIVANSTTTPYEIDLGSLPANVLVPAFNGVGQSFGGGANTWKGIVLLSVD